MIATATRALALVFGAAGMAGPADFAPPVDVEIRGYGGHAMEPFLSRDGAWLLFNSRNLPGDRTDLHAARRLSDLVFAYAGPLRGANSDALDGVPSLDRQGTLYFVSPRAYDATRNTLWQGRFEGGAVTDIAPVRGGAVRRQPLWLNIDAEISAAGDTLYYTENRWNWLAGEVATSNLMVAVRAPDGGFERPAGPDIFAAINTGLLEYAPALTEDELTIYFTRADRAALRRGDPGGFGVFVATRPDRRAPFSAPERIEALQGYVEAATVAPGGCAIYVHQRLGGVFRIRRSARRDC